MWCLTLVMLPPITVYRTRTGFNVCADLVWNGIILFRYLYYYYVLTMLISRMTGMFMMLMSMGIPFEQQLLACLILSHFVSVIAHLTQSFCAPVVLLEYWTKHTIIGFLYVTFIFSTKIFSWGCPGFATDCPCGVWCRALTTCLMYVCPLFRYLVWTHNGVVSLTLERTIFHCFIFMFYIYLNVS